MTAGTNKWHLESESQGEATYILGISSRLTLTLGYVLGKIALFSARS